MVELLVAIAILSIVVALIVPRLRLVSKDRNIREAARVVGSVFSSARDRAIAEGSAGVVLVRNPNFVSQTGDNNSVFYAGTRLYQMRSMPPYVGDSLADFATIQLFPDENSPEEIRAIIPLPLEFGIGVVRVNDFIRFNNSPASYRIAQVLKPIPTNDPMFLPLVLAWDNNPALNQPTLDLSSTDFTTNWPAPRYTSPVTFSIERQPRIIQSTETDLPAGYIIDLRYSGPSDDGTIESLNLPSQEDDPETRTIFGTASLQPNEVQILFNSQGAIDRIIVDGISFLAGQSLFFFINEYEPELAAPNINTQQAAEALLTNPENSG